MSSGGVTVQKHERVLANMVIGSNGATSLQKDSAPLSPPADRERFHAIRRFATSLVVGGNTYRCEHYSKAPLPVFVATRNPELLSQPQSTVQGESAFINAEPKFVLQKALEKKGAVALVEGGISFINPLISEQQIDRLFLTRSPLVGDGDYFDFALLERHYQLEKSERIDDVIFEEWIPKRS